MKERPVFGQDAPPPRERPGSMSYVARAACGHVRVMQVDSRSSSLGEFVALGLRGLTLERIPTSQARAEFGECGRCKEPEQLGAFT